MHIPRADRLVSFLRLGPAGVMLFSELDQRNDTLRSFVQYIQSIATHDLDNGSLTMIPLVSQIQALMKEKARVARQSPQCGVPRRTVVTAPWGTVRHHCPQ